MRVLVIDDHKGFRDELRRILTRYGHDVDDTESAMDGIPLAESGRYDFLLLDYQMPGHDGLWFMRNVRIPRHTKVLLVTGHVHRALIAEIFRAGAAGYLIKPFEEEDLLRHLAFHSARRTSVPAESAATSAGNAPKERRNQK